MSLRPWRTTDSKDIYNIDHWGDGFFDVNDQGRVVVYPLRKDYSPGIDLHDLTNELINEDLTLPILIRFPDILKQRVMSLCKAFQRAIGEFQYLGKYTAVYPIKVNQQRYVVSEILKVDDKYPVGLEAGSKGELMAVLALTKNSGSVIVCNGYKDSEYIRLALIGKRLGHRIYIILEKISEIEIVLREARKMDIVPNLGIRIRTSSVAAGKWQKTGGEKSKFGLTSSQVLEVIDRLRKENCLDTLKFLHFHLGSQIANIGDVQNGIREGARYYCELHAQGAKIETVDLGGGLGVDYDGTHSRSFTSMNYTMQEYANNIVYILQEICQERGLPCPDIVTESGRAMAAHHAVLVTNIVDSEVIKIPKEFNLTAEDLSDVLIKNLYDGLQALTPRSAMEAYHDACYWMQEANSKFLYGILSIKKRALIEQLYWATCYRVRDLLELKVRAHREIIDELNEKLADKYFLNFSLFQSLPDAWAIDQVFPVMPISGLNQVPDRRVILQDLTCDSDGAIDYYIDGQEVEKTLPLPAYHPGEPYNIGIFLVGAYQEILGDMHNLFGDTDSVNIILREDGSYEISQPDAGDLVKDVLQYVHFDSEKLIQSFQNQLEQNAMPAELKQKYLDLFIAGMNGYTYLED